MSNEIEMVKCKECGKEFKNVYGLVLHIAKMHNAEMYFLKYINKDPNVGKCKCQNCDNSTTFRGLFYGSEEPYQFSVQGYDDYCCISCAHADINGKFQAEGQGYKLRSITAEHSAQEILDKRDFYQRKRVKYLPESEYLVCLSLIEKNINFVWQKAFQRYNADFYFPELNLVIELHENNHKYEAYKNKDKKRRISILGMPQNKDLRWIKIPILKEDPTEVIVNKMLEVLNTL